MKISLAHRGLQCLAIAVLLVLYSCNKKSDPVTLPANKVAYVYKTDNSGAQAYKTLLDANGCEVTMVDITTVTTHDFSVYKLIIVGHNTATSGVGWTAQDANALKNSGKAMLLTGVGGVRLADQLGNTVNHGGSASGNELAIKVLDANHAVFKSPKSITIPVNQQIQILNSNTSYQGFYAPVLPVANVVFIGQDPASTNYYPVSYENNRYGIFGFYANPTDMTQAGKDFLVNFVYFTGKF